MINFNDLLATLGQNAMLSLIWYVLLVVAQWKIFTKAGEAGWKSIIPIYNSYILFKIAGMSFIKTLIIIIVLVVLLIVMPIIAISTLNAALSFASGIIALVLAIYIIVIACKLCDNLSKAFGHGLGYAVGLFFLNPIFMLILGFGSDEYQGVKSK